MILEIAHLERIANSYCSICFEILMYRSSRAIQTYTFSSFGSFLKYDPSIFSILLWCKSLNSISFRNNTESLHFFQRNETAREGFCRNKSNSIIIKCSFKFQNQTSQFKSPYKVSRFFNPCNRLSGKTSIKLKLNVLEKCFKKEIIYPIYK